MLPASIPMVTFNTIKKEGGFSKLPINFVGNFFSVKHSINHTWPKWV